MSSVNYYVSKDEIEKSLGDVYYEIQSLCNSHFIFKNFHIIALTDLRINRTLNNIVLENILLHARCLIDFFEKSKRSIYHDRITNSRMANDDVLSSDFNFKPSDLGIDLTYKERLNKDLAHLTYSRTKRTETTKKWSELDKMVKIILKRSYEFIKHLEDIDLLGIINNNKWIELKNNIELILKQ